LLSQLRRLNLRLLVMGASLRRKIQFGGVLQQ
jgi:hypothetical protein